MSWWWPNLFSWRWHSSASSKTGDAHQSSSPSTSMLDRLALGCVVSIRVLSHVQRRHDTDARRPTARGDRRRCNVCDCATSLSSSARDVRAHDTVPWHAKRSITKSLDINIDARDDNYQH
jgi:hypothetical protein